MGVRSRARNLSVLLAVGLALAGCASGPQPSDNHHRRFRVGQPNYTVAPYQVNGVWYYPRVDYGYDENGTASWYGPGFDGRATADGEIYDMNQPSAAHKTLPLPSVVEVTNLQNGRALRLRVNDRGPFIDGRVIDVSRRAAQLLGFEIAGTAPVRVKILKDESIQVAEAAMRGESGHVLVAQAPLAAEREPTARVEPRPAIREAAAGPPSLRAAEVIAAPLPAQPAPSSPAPHRSWPTLIAPAQAETLHVPSQPPPAFAPRAVVPAAAKHAGRIFVQAGAFAVPENAQRVRARIAALGSVEIVPATAGGTALYRVRLGPLASAAEAARLLGKVVDSGYPGARVVGE